MAPSVDALAREYRVITASLPGEPGVDAAFDADADFDVFVRHLDDVLDASGVADAILCGVSFGGLIALRYAAMRSHRVRGLILVSTPGPRWRLNPSQARYAKWPALSSPAVRARRGSPRMARVAGAVSPSARAAVGLRQSRVARRAGAGRSAPHGPARPSGRAPEFRGRLRAREGADARRDRRETTSIWSCPCDETMSYLDLIHGSSFQLFERTGHLGTVLAPDRFAAIVSRFCRAL